MSAIRGILIAVGTAAMAYAILAILTSDATNPKGQLVFLAGLLVAHEGILLPLALGVGALTVRFVPRWARGGVQAGLYASAVVTVLAIPFVLGFGRDPGNPSILPLNYGRGLLIVLAVIWAGVAAAIGYARLRSRPRTDAT